ncbi:tyrosine-type recombinase/integrase [Nitratireductor sp. CH_MIT9313-5]|uniref:tyrosine-type recombinase/integrase n=1 Tax=Nitratireductor sp. CH_MIT9313-5 TaxID=3107764 RepID=UPI00300BC8B6
MYLWRRKSGYVFQMRIPAQQVKKLGKSPLRIPLGPLSAREAQRRATILAGSARLMMEEVGMTGEALSKSLTALAEEMRMLEKKEFSLGLRMVNAAPKWDDMTPEEMAQLESRRKTARELSLQAERNATKAFRERLEALGNELQKDKLVWEAERSTYERIVKLASTLTPPAAASTVPPPNAPEDAPTSGEYINKETLLSVAVKPTLEARREALEADGNRNRYAERVISSVEAFLDIVGDYPLRHYRPIHLQEYATVMGRVPTNRRKYKQFEGLSLREVADRNDRMGARAIQRLSTSSINGCLSEVKSTWKKATASVEGVADLGAASVTMPKSAALPIDREGLSSSAINKWLKDAASQSEPHRRWVPLLALLTGMRLSEIVYLRASDLVLHEGHLIVDLRRDMDVDGVTVKRPLKTKSSKRIVALHRLLHDCGFISWAQEQQGYLFSDFHKAKDPADAAQKRMANWMSKLGIRNRQREVFHSLRHNAKAWLRTETDARTADLQCGHAPDSVGARYGFKYLQPEEIAKIERAQLPNGIEFGNFLKH